MGLTFGPEQSFAAITFSDIAAGLPGVFHGSVAWGDYDSDGDLDLVMTGQNGSAEQVAAVYRNDAGAFNVISAGIPGVDTGSVAWGDYDNDGDLDLVVTGWNGSEEISRMYRNDAGGFADIGASLPGVSAGSAAWGDYDNDGDLDLVLTGYTGGTPDRITRLYRNDAGSFNDIAAGLPAVTFSSAAWGDCDNDGDLDLLLAGQDLAISQLARIYRNDGGVFTDIVAGLTGVDTGSAAWGDYDSDGDLDLVLTGWTGSDESSRVYRNDAGSFNAIGAGLPGVTGSVVAWVDYDNDGDLDLLLSGYEGPGSFISKVYRNDAGSLNEIVAGLPGVWSSAAAWGDYDHDGDLDILLTGDTGAGLVARVYRSDGASANTPPATPPNLSAQGFGSTVTFSWDAATDGETPAAGLSYNLRLGTTPGGSEVVSAMADKATGYRRVPALGNAQQRTSWTVTLPSGNYYWSVQAVDGAFAGSQFASEEYLELGFVDIGAGLPGVSGGSAAWGDCDNDGDLDILLTGDTGSEHVARVYRNDTGSFADIGAGLPDVWVGSAVAWGDYDNDGDLDILLTGAVGMGSETDIISRVYRNDAGSFADIGAGLQGVVGSAVAWGDYDNDGDLDILLAGIMNPEYDVISRVYRNDAGSFADIGAGLTGVDTGSLAWGDYDNDGDLDILLTGDMYSEHLRISRVYRNDAGSFSDIAAGLPGVYWGSAAWGDYDNDGDLDILLTGWSDSEYDVISRVYRNDAGSFADIGAGLPGVEASAAAWGDYDNDGDLDLVLTGDTTVDTTEVPYLARVYRNDGGGFSDIGAGLPGISNPEGDTSVAWGDYDNDGDLDILLTGETGSGYVARVYRNDGTAANVPPAAPSGLSASVLGDQAILSWTPASDAETPAAGLSYNIRIGTTPLGNEICSGMADSVSGYRRVVQMGNAQQETAWTVTLPDTTDTYYWSVQAVDGAFAGSAFAAEEIIGSTVAVVEATPRGVSFAIAGTNPAVGKARFRFALPTRAHVSLSIYNVAGRRMAKLVDEELAPGYHVVEWAGQGMTIRSGVYFAQFHAGGREFTQRFVVLR